MNQCKEGQCHICGKIEKLTFEHVPPKKVFNDRIAYVYKGVDVLVKGKKEAKYFINQKGMGDYTLCQQCNNNTGAWFADEYIRFSKATIYALGEYKNLVNGQAIHFESIVMKPLKIVKQIIAMFCSTLSFDIVQEYGFDKFLLHKESNDIDTSNFDLRIYLTEPKWGAFTTGQIIPIIQKEDKLIALRFAELGSYPFGFILNLNPNNELNYGVSLNAFFKTKYNVECHVQLDIPYLKRKSDDKLLPLDFEE